MGKLIERQVIVTWYTPAEKLPPQDGLVICTINGEADGVKFDHAMVMLEWDDNDGWWSMDYSFTELEVLAWCDLEPYGGK